MADTRVQLEAEDWVRREWLPKQFGQRFSRERLRLESGGVFDFDAVSADERIVVTISTSAGKTSSGKHAVGKLMKLRSDMLFLTMLSGERQRISLVTDQTMLDMLTKERAGGRVPRNIEFLHAPLPAELAERLQRSQKAASRESLGLPEEA
jgi:hypothetical protein